MKRFLNTVLIVISVAVFSYGQNGKTTEVNPCNTNGLPILIKNGETFTATCDSMYVVNKARFNFYRNIHKLTLSETDATFKLLLKAYEDRLSENELAYQRLLDNSKTYEGITNELIGYSKASLESTQKSLDVTQNSLCKSINDLNSATEILKEERKNGRKDKLLFGFGGVGIGILIGVLVMK